MAPESVEFASTFFHEASAYDLLIEAGLGVPRHGWLGEDLPFRPGESVVLKGLAEGLWHKSERGCVRFLDFDRKDLEARAEEMRLGLEGGSRWLGALVCERIRPRRPEDLPGEAFAALKRGEGGWVLLVGFGGLQAEALAELAPPLLWPMGWVGPAEALRELEGHLLGRAWLGGLRLGQPLTTRARLSAFLEGLWRAAALAEREGLDLLELNPVVVGPEGEILPLDGVGRRGVPALPRPPRDPGFLKPLLSPGTVALAGVSAREGSAGRSILDNLRSRSWKEGALRLVKPGSDAFLGLPCLPHVRALAADPVDLLILSLPAPAAVQAIEDLIDEGSGAQVVLVVAGGLGDGADAQGWGERLRLGLEEARARGRWTPALLGPNCLGHVVPAEALNTWFIPQDRSPLPRPGPLALLSQSGAFLLSCLSKRPELGIRMAVALGNQMDLRASDFLQAVGEDPEVRAVGVYLEGFAPGDLLATARAAARLRERGVPVLLHRAGRTEAGQEAAAGHTGSMAGDRSLEEALLRRAGLRLSSSHAAFDAALAWLSAWPNLGLDLGPTALMSNAGFEAVAGADLVGERIPPARLGPQDVDFLRQILERHELDGLVAPKLPLDLTPMAGATAYLDGLEALLKSEAQVVVVGLVPFAERLDTRDPTAAAAFGRGLADRARAHRKAVGLVVDAGPAYGAYRRALAESGLPVFEGLEEALAGLEALAPTRW